MNVSSFKGISTLSMVHKDGFYMFFGSRAGIPISELSRETGLAMTTLTNMLGRMEEIGLIRRDRGDAYCRKILIYLTENAKTLKHDYDEVTQEISDIYYKGFTEEEIRQFEIYLRRILANVERRI